VKFFQDKKIERKEVKKPVVDNSAFIKQNLMKSVDRSKLVREAVERWLFSFDGAMTRDRFEGQMRRLDFDDEKALLQLQKAVGRRTIPLPPAPRPPVMEKSIVETMVEDTYVAVSGRRHKKLIKEAVKELKKFGDVYVLSIEELIVEFKSFNEKGKGPQMIEKAIETDFLIIVDLEMPIHLEWHINEAIERIGRLREKNKKPIISTWNRFNDCNRFFERFKIYD
jgi:ribosomal protein L23